MALISATPTLSGLPTEVRLKIFQDYFAEDRPNTLISLDIAIDLNNPTAAPRSKIRRARNVSSPLFQVSKQIAAEATKVRRVGLIISVVDKKDLPAQNEAFNRIPREIKSQVDTVKVYPVHNVGQDDDDDMKLKHFPYAQLLCFPALQSVTMMYIRTLLILPYNPIATNWVSDYRGGVLIPPSTEREILEGELDDEIEVAVSKSIDVVESLIPSDAMTFDLRFSFELMYDSLVTFYKSDVDRSRARNDCWPIWSHTKKQFILGENGRLLSWREKILNQSQIV